MCVCVCVYVRVCKHKFSVSAVAGKASARSGTQYVAQTHIRACGEMEEEQWGKTRNSFVRSFRFDRETGRKR